MGAEIAHSCSNTGKNEDDGIINIPVRSAQQRNARNLTFRRESLKNCAAVWSGAGFTGLWIRWTVVKVCGTGGGKTSVEGVSFRSAGSMGPTSFERQVKTGRLSSQLAFITQGRIARATKAAFRSYALDNGAGLRG